jgi:regulator of RNase E activity RraA
MRMDCTRQFGVYNRNAIFAHARGNRTMTLDREELIRRYRALSAATVYDVLDKLGHPNQALHSDIRPLVPQFRMAGPALTIHGRSMGESDGRWGTAFSYEMFRTIRSGDVIVFDCGGHRQGGPWGGNTGANARARGAAGIVIDGGTRDYTDLVEMDFPTCCRFVTPVLAHGRFQVHGFNEPITMSGQVYQRVAVRPADFVVADADGVVIVPQELLAEVLEFAEAAEKAEAQIRQALDAGEDRESVDRRIDRFALIKARRKSD